MHFVKARGRRPPSRGGRIEIPAEPPSGCACAPVFLSRTVYGISPMLLTMELVFSQRAESNRDRISPCAGPLPENRPGCWPDSNCDIKSAANVFLQKQRGYSSSSSNSRGWEINWRAPAALSSSAFRKPHSTPTENIPAATAVRISVGVSPR